MLRQFAGLWLVFFGGLAAVACLARADGQLGDRRWPSGVVVGVAGLVEPAVVRPIYTGWMIAAFPIGWTVSQLMLCVVFYLVFTPVGLVFRLMGATRCGLRRRDVSVLGQSRRAQAEDYFRQF